MSSSEIAISGAAAPGSVDFFEHSLEAEEHVEHDMFRSIVKGVAIAIPIGILFFVGMLAVAIGDRTVWYAWVLMGALMGVIGGILFGVLGAVTVAAHKLDAVDHDAQH